MRGMSDVLHIKLCAGYEPTNNAMAFGLLAVIPVKPRLSDVIHHDAFQWFGAFKPEQVLGFKGTIAMERKYFCCNEGAVVAYLEQPNWPHLLVLMCLCRVKLVVQGCESVGFWESISAPLQPAIRVISLTFFMATAVAIMMLGDYAVIG